MSSSNSTPSRIARRGVLKGIGLGCAAAALTTPTVLQAATPTILSGAGDVRSLNLFNSRTGESLRTIFWIEGQYITEACAEANWFLRDWREDVATKIDPKALDILAAVHLKLETQEPLEILSAYRTKRTNNMLRARSRSVARDSYHVKGMACDITLKSRSTRQVQRAALSLHGGGVGRYSRSGFVHVDSGPERSWGR